MPTAKIFGGVQPSTNKTTNITDGRRCYSWIRDPFVDGFPRAFQLVACRAMVKDLFAVDSLIVNNTYVKSHFAA